MDKDAPLPFRLYEAGLDQLQRLVHANTAFALRALRHGEAFATTAEGTAPGAVPAAPSPSRTATAGSALASALNEEARAALGRYAETAHRVTEGLEVHDAPAPNEPARELGPEPFKP